jgi:hypothetical protein
LVCFFLNFVLIGGGFRRAASDSYQGTALAVPLDASINEGFSP